MFDGKAPDPADIPESMTKDEAMGWMLVVAQIFAILGLVLMAAGAYPFPILNWALLGIGLSISAAAAIQMGKSIRVHADANGAGLVTSGLFSFVRNPIYFGLLIALAGINLANPRPFTWAVYGFLVLILAIKISSEEKSLRAIYPDYADYAKRTKRLIPYIW